MNPETKNGLNAMTCVSAMQKAIRGGSAKRWNSRSNSCTRPKPSTRWSVTDWRSSAMKTLTRWRAPRVPLRHRIAGGIAGPLGEVHRRSPIDGRQCDPHDVARAEVPRRLSFRSRRRPAVIAGARPRQSPTGRSISTRSRARRWVALSTTSAAKVRR
jgi:hypothetical protein